jgi:N-acetylneuraminate synthase
MKTIKIGKRSIGANYPAYFVADIGANHDGDLERAKELIYLCAESGVDAVKFQNFKAHKIVSKEGFEHLIDKESHQAKWKKSVFDVYKDASINEKWTRILKETSDKAGVEYFTSPYDFESVDLVDPFVKMHKIGSGDITWLEIIKYIAKKGKPVLIATGASTLEDVKRAMKTLQKYTNKIVLLQCNTNYTASLENFKYSNLNVLKRYGEIYPNVILGLSDHTPGHATVLGAVTLGARLIEKHFTDDNNRIGPDHKFAMTPKTWKEMVDRTRELEFALGDGIKRIEKNEKKTAIIQRRGMHATQDLPKGTILKKDYLEPLRPIPTGGIEPYELEKMLNKRLIKPLKKGDHITWKHIAR